MPRTRPGAAVADPVNPRDRYAVYLRDRGCIAPQLDRQAGPCRDQWGHVVTLAEQERLILRDDMNTRLRRARVLTLDHVPPTPGGPRVSTPRWMVTACWGHGVANGPGGTQWVTSHREEERDYLARKEAQRVQS